MVCLEVLSEEKARDRNLWRKENSSVGMDYQDRARISRATSQRLFLIEKEWTQDQVLFDVMGSTGNVYRVSCDETEDWTCNCPDHERRKQDCKHIYFIKIKVLKNLHSWEELSSSNLSELVVDSSVLIQEDLKKAYEEKKRTIESPSTEIKEPIVLPPKERKEWLNQECMVCCELMLSSDEPQLFTCSTCMNSIHGICWSMWSRTKEACVYCRAPCEVPKQSNKKRKKDEESDYINLLS